MNQDTFSFGVVCMACNCLPAVELVKSGRWTMDDMEKWLQAVISNDAAYLESIRDQLDKLHHPQ